ncbi:hypothetical protein I4U23_021851 [Adineta vaga]|nr:hypothetical protein I4U23_021851 [Adineta vaga]
MSGIAGKRSFIIASIIIDVLNLGEQIGIYFAQKAEQLEEYKERQFFFILLGISAANLFKSIFLNERIKIGISFLIEIGELFCYLFVLQRTLTVMIISLTFFGFQFLCYIITFYLVQTNDQTKPTTHRIRGFIYRLAMYIGTNGGPLLTLFLSSESQFRQTLYEVSIIISIFLSTISFEISNITNSSENQVQIQRTTGWKMPVCLNFEQFMKDSSRIERAWAYVTYIISIVFSCFYMAILTVALASLELQGKGSQLPSYDRGVCIYFLVITSCVLLASPCFCCVIFFVVYGIVSNKSMSR